MINHICDSVSVRGEFGETHHAEVQFVEDTNGFHIDVFAPDAPITRVLLRWNHVLADGLRILGDHLERGYGDLEWRGFVPERILPWYALLFDPNQSKTQGIGVCTGAASFAMWRIDQQGITLILDVGNGAQGTQLGSRVLRAATVKVLASEDAETPFAFAHRFCRLLCNTPRLPQFPVYGGNDWYFAYGNNSDEGIRRDAALVRELSPSGDNAPFMVIDDGWSPNFTSGPYDSGNERFPDMAELASAIGALDVRPGIWTRPLRTASARESWQMPTNHPIWNRGEGVFLDPSIPDVLQLVHGDISRMGEWGYKLIKHDFSTFDIIGQWGFEMEDGTVCPGGWHFDDKSRTTAEIVLGLYRTIRDAAEDALLIGCNTVGHLGAGLFELQRTGDDTSGREWERTRKMGINTLAFRMVQHGAFFAVDADCVGVTDEIPWELNRQWLALLAASGTPLFASIAPDAVGPDQRTALTEAFARAANTQPSAEPLDWLETTCPRRWQFGAEWREFDWGMVG